MIKIKDRHTKKYVTPRKYSNGNSQLDLINKIILNFQNNKVISLIAGTGSGKSIIALEVLRHFGGGYLVVPRKDHQDQYRKDYSDFDSNFVIIGDNNEELKIKLLKGKSNFKCKIVDKLYSKKKIDNVGSKIYRADYHKHPCNYRKQVNGKIERCPYQYTYMNIDSDHNKQINIHHFDYESIRGTKRIRLYSEKLCGYYDQLFETINNEIVILNSKKLESDCITGNLPKKDTLVIDEYDLFLDELVSPKKIDIVKLIKFFSERKNIFIRDIQEKSDNEDKEILKSHIEKLNIVIELLMEIFSMNYKTNDLKNKIISKLDDLRRFIDIEDNDELIDIKNLLMNENLEEFEYFIEKEKNENFATDDLEKYNFKLNYFTINIEKKVNSIFSNFERVLLMSATKHSNYITKEFFGLDPLFVKGEETIQGKLYFFDTDNFVDFSYPRNYNEMSKEQKEKFRYEQRKRITKATTKLFNELRNVDKKWNVLMHINNISLLPSKEEKLQLLKNDMWSKEEYLSYRNSNILQDKFEDFKNKKISFYASTTMFRAIDLPNDKCRVIFFQKLPYPVPNFYYQSISKRYGFGLMRELMNDKCNRELSQGIARGLRHKSDWCIIASPDQRVIDRIKNIMRNKL